MDDKNYLVPREVILGIHDFLTTLPYKQVAGGIAALDKVIIEQDIKKVPENGNDQLDGQPAN